MKKNKLSAVQTQMLFEVLKKRFEKNPHRHKGLKWADVYKKLEEADDKLWPLHAMEETGGEPDVIGYDKTSAEYIFCDCATETPKGRRSICYDDEALATRKEHKPKTSAMAMVKEMGIELLDEQQYRYLQTIENVDTKTSSWIATPKDIRDLGGALFGDRRFGHVFIYHNGAESYYGVRGFRGILKV